MYADVVPGGVDPPVQPWPFAEQRLVCHLDRGRAGAGVAVEGEEARRAVGVNRLRQGDLVELNRVKLVSAGAAAGVLGAFSERDQSQEELPGRILGRIAEPCVDFFGATG